MTSPLQIAVLVLLGAALWSVFYIVNVLSREREEPRTGRGSTRSSPSKKRENGLLIPEAMFRFLDRRVKGVSSELHLREGGRDRWTG